jgi:hypothetical protein
MDSKWGSLQGPLINYSAKESIGGAGEWAPHGGYGRKAHADACIWKAMPHIGRTMVVHQVTHVGLSF